MGNSVARMHQMYYNDFLSKATHSQTTQDLLKHMQIIYEDDVFVVLEKPMQNEELVAIKLVDQLLLFIACAIGRCISVLDYLHKRLGFAYILGQSGTTQSSEKNSCNFEMLQSNIHFNKMTAESPLMNNTQEIFLSPLKSSKSTNLNRVMVNPLDEDLFPNEVTSFQDISSTSSKIDDRKPIPLISESSEYPFKQTISASYSDKLSYETSPADRIGQMLSKLDEAIQRSQRLVAHVDSNSAQNAGNFLCSSNNSSKQLYEHEEFATRSHIHSKPYLGVNSTSNRMDREKSNYHLAAQNTKDSHKDADNTIILRSEPIHICLEDYLCQCGECPQQQRIQKDVERYLPYRSKTHQYTIQQILNAFATYNEVVQYDPNMVNLADDCLCTSRGDPNTAFQSFVALYDRTPANTLS